MSECVVFVKMNISTCKLRLYVPLEEPRATAVRNGSDCGRKGDCGAPPATEKRTRWTPSSYGKLPKIRNSATLTQ